jgi:hypothetical protein
LDIREEIPVTIDGINGVKANTAVFIEAALGQLIDQCVQSPLLSQMSSAELSALIVETVRDEIEPPTRIISYIEALRRMNSKNSK